MHADDSNALNGTIGFIDESGNPNLETDKEGADTHFIVAAVMVSRAKRIEFENKVEAVKNDLFAGSEMKSSNIGSNDNRRIEVLLQLARADFWIQALVVDKRRIMAEGLRYKRSFVKFMHNLLWQELSPRFLDLEIWTDQYGDREFMDEFARYIEDHFVAETSAQMELDLHDGRSPPNVFLREPRFHFAESSSCVGVQVADIISGTLRKIFDETARSSRAQDFLDVLKDRIASIRQWPSIGLDDLPATASVSEYDTRIRLLSLQLAQAFVKNNEHHDDPDVWNRVSCVKLLAFNARNFTPPSFVGREDILEHLRLPGKNPGRYFRSEIVAPLRDNSIPVCASERGYKLATCEADLREYVEYCYKRVFPFRQRLNRIREAILSATANEVDIMGAPQYHFLRDN